MSPAYGGTERVPTGGEASQAGARVRIYAGRNVLEPGESGASGAATAEKATKGIRLDALRQAALADAAARAGMTVALDPDLGCERVFVEATGTIAQAQEALKDLRRMKFSGYMAETDRPEAEDEISRYHGEVVWDVALVQTVREPRRPEVGGHAGGRAKVLVGWYGVDHSRPGEPNVSVSRVRYPLVVQDPAADADDPAVDESGYREIVDDASLKAWADREYEWWEVKDL